MNEKYIWRTILNAGPTDRDRGIKKENGMKINEVKSKTKTKMTVNEICECLEKAHNVIVVIDDDGDLVCNDEDNLIGWRLMPDEQILDVLK